MDAKEVIFLLSTVHLYNSLAYFGIKSLLMTCMNAFLICMLSVFEIISSRNE